MNEADRLSIKVLGDVEVHADGRPLAVDTRKAIALLVYLAVGGTSASRDQLCALLWRELDPERARGALRRTLSVLRRALGGRWLLTEADRVRIEPGGHLRTDVAEVERLRASVSEHGHDVDIVCPECRDPLQEAASLYRGDFMAGFSVRDSPDFEEWQLHQADVARRRQGVILDFLAEALALRGEYSRAVEAARRRLALTPLDEAAHRQVMLMSVWSGDRAAALRQYRECVRVLDEELGVPPLPETSSLEEAILCDDIPPPPAGQVETGHPAGPDPRPGSGSGSGSGWSIVGRQRERAQLEALEEGTGGTAAIITGPPGVGKSRLADEVTAALALGGRNVAAARAYEGEDQLGLVLVGDAIRAALDAWERPPPLDPMAAAEASRLVPELRSEQPDPLAMPRDPGGQSRFVDAVCSVLATLLGANGNLVLDDLQWADAASLDLVAYLLRRTDRFPIHTILIWRGVPGGFPTLHRLVEAMRNEGRGAVIELSPLTDAEVRELSAQLSPGLDPRAAEQVIAGSDGSPLVALQYLRMVDEGTGLLRDEAIAHGKVAEARLQGISELGRQVLTAASVIARAFDPDEVRAASGRSDDEVTTAMEELIATGLVHETDQGLLDFSHDLVREHVRDAMSAVRRRLLHGRLADHLERRRRHDPSALAGRIAHHLEQAGRPDEAAGYRMAAGDHARSVFAHQEALRHYEAALALGHRDAVGTNTAIGDLHTLGGDYAAALDAYRNAAARAAGHDLAAVEHRLGEINGRLGRWEPAVRHFEAAERGLDAPGDLIDLYTDWARLARRMGDDDRARELVDKAARTDDGPEASQPMIMVMQGLFSAEPASGERRVQEGLERARELSDPGAQAAALNALALIARGEGRLDVAIDRVHSALRLVERIGDRHRQATLHDLLADLLHESGDEAAAMEQLTRAVQLFAEVGTGGFEPEIWKTAPW